MKKTDRIIEILNDLIKINKDRVTGFEMIVHKEDDTEPEIRNFFYAGATESRSFINELHSELLKLGGAPVSVNTVGGRLYHFWLNLNVTFSGEDPQATLAACDAGGEAILDSYREIPELRVDLPVNIKKLIENQEFALKRSQELIKKYRQEYSIAK